MRPNFFANTPDILHEYLQHGGPPAFKIRAVLAAMLSPTWGIYSGYELCENVPLRPGSEEYLDSEKYQYRPRDWEAAARDGIGITATSPSSTGSGAPTRPCTGCAICASTASTSPDSCASPSARRTCPGGRGTTPSWWS